MFLCFRRFLAQQYNVRPPLRISTATMEPTVIPAMADVLRWCDCLSSAFVEVLGKAPPLVLVLAVLVKFVVSNTALS